MAEVLTKVQLDLVDKIARDHDFGKYQMTTSKGSEKGDNFLGILTLITLDNGDKKLELILKSAHEKKSFRKAAPIRRAYIREIYLYESVFEEFKQFQKDHNVADAFDCYAKIYGYSLEEENECLIMENLRVKGYQLWNKQVPMNSQHITAVLVEYAKFHATCIAMKHKNPEKYEKLTEGNKKNIWQEEEEGKYEGYMKYIKQTMAVGHRAVKGIPDLEEFLQQVEVTLSDLMYNELRKPEYQEVFVHGDCWCNNIMFQYDNQPDKMRPSSLRIVDWQMSYVNSPAHDFCYFFLIHSPKEILDDFENYLKVYYEALSLHLERFNCYVDELFPFSRFAQHVNRYMVYGMYVSFIIMKIMLSDSNEAPDITQLTEGQVFIETLDITIKKNDLLNERLRTIIVFVKENNFFNS